MAKLESVLFDTTLRERLAIRARDAARNMDWSSLAERLLCLFSAPSAGDRKTLSALGTPIGENQDEA